MARQLRYPHKVSAFVTDKQHAALEALSLATKDPTADIVRDAIDFYLAATPPPAPINGRGATDTCQACGAPYEPHEKWNGGNPRTFMFPTCDCAEKEAERMAERLAARMAEIETGGKSHA